MLLELPVWSGLEAHRGPCSCCRYCRGSSAEQCRGTIALKHGFATVLPGLGGAAVLIVASRRSILLLAHDLVLQSGLNAAKRVSTRARDLSQVDASSNAQAAPAYPRHLTSHLLSLILCGARVGLLGLLIVHPASEIALVAVESGLILLTLLWQT